MGRGDGNEQNERNIRKKRGWEEINHKARRPPNVSHAHHHPGRTPFPILPLCAGSFCTTMRYSSREKASWPLHTYSPPPAGQIPIMRKARPAVHLFPPSTTSTQRLEGVILPVGATRKLSFCSSGLFVGQGSIKQTCPRNLNIHFRSRAASCIRSILFPWSRSTQCSNGRDRAGTE